MMTEQEKRDRLKEIAPHVWDMYRLLLEGRVINHENRLNFFLAVDALFIVGYVGLFEDQLSDPSLWYVIPFLFFFFPAVALLVDFITRAINVPWFEEDQLVQVLDKDRFQLNLIIWAYVSAFLTWEFQKRSKKLLDWCFYSVMVALGWLLLIFILHLCESDLSGAERMAILILVVAGIGAVIYVAWSNQKCYDTEKWQKRVSDKFQNWLKQDVPESNENTKD